VFREKSFNLSILFSCVWHLFWISAICIVVTPTVQPSNLYPEVGFLGPILEKTAFDLMVDEVTPQKETLYAREALFVDNIYLKPKGPERKVVKQLIPDAVFDRFNFVLQDYVKDAKESPLYFASGIRSSYRKTFSGDSPPLVEGPAGERAIIFKPEAPTVSKGLYGEASEYDIKLKFFVSGDGIVYEVEPVVSCGYPEIELEAVKSLKRWRFSSLSLVQKDKSTWGIVAIRIIAK